MNVDISARFGTVSERISDESLTRLGTLFVLYNMLWLGKCVLQHAESLHPLAAERAGITRMDRQRRQMAREIMVNNL